MIFLIWLSIFLLNRWVGQTDHRPPRELQTEAFRARYDPAAWLSNRAPVSSPSPDAASVHSHIVPAMFPHAPAPPASSSAPGSGSTGPHVPCSSPDTSPPHRPRPLSQSAHPAVQQASWWFLQHAQWHKHRGRCTGPKYHGFCPSR